MNKKFLSAVLFGALMVSSTGTFVSCKDYDDDIDELTSRVDGVEGQIKDLEAKINAANWITSVTPATGGFTVAFNDGSSYTITNGKDGEAGAAGTEWTISEDGFWVCNGEKTTVKAVGQDGAQGEPGKDAQPEVKKETASGICGTVQNLKNLPVLLLQQMFLTTTLILLILTTTLSWLFVTKTVRMKNLFVCP